MPHSTRLRRSALLSHRLCTGIALGAIGLFTAIAANLVPILFYADLAEVEARGRLAVPLLLSSALILLAWRRALDARRLHDALEASRARELRLAYFDETTGLHNRRYLMKEVIGRLRSETVIFLLLDLDGFKQVNDLYGHEAGDELLQGIAVRISELVPPSADAVRLGGDEFAICLTGDDAGVGTATLLSQALVTALCKPFPIGDTEARVGVSIGISMREGPHELATASLQRADVAMYEAKRLGRGRAVWFDADMERVRNERTRLEAAIRAGLERGEFVPHFQPLLDLASLRIRGFEVFARWHHPRQGTLGPDSFLAVAEGCGLIAELSLGVMRAALAQAVHWPAELSLAVNLSPVQFKDPLLADRVLQLLRQTAFPATRLEVEVSEQTLLTANERVLAIVHKLRDAGVRVALDDFGSGYAGLARFRELPFDRLKIDRDFVASLRNDKQSDAFVQAIATLGKSLSLPITAEGIEEETIQDLLVTLGATDGQGWLYGEALPGEDAARKYLDIDIEPSPITELELAPAEVIPLRPSDRRATRR